MNSSAEVPAHPLDLSDSSYVPDLPWASVALSTYLEPTLWFDVASRAHRSDNGHWTGGWTPPALPQTLPSRDQARQWLESEPLGAPWVARLDQAPELAPDARRFNLLSNGPCFVLDVAREVILLLREQALPCTLIGSSGIFLQRAFRLSADVDVSLPAPLSDASASALARCLQEAGVEVGVVKTTYVFGVHRATGVTIDIEAGTAYRQPLKAAHWERVRTINNLPVMGLQDLLRFKAMMGRDKDVADARWLAAAGVPGHRT